MSTGGGNGVAGLGVACNSVDTNAPQGVGASRVSGPVMASSGMVSLLAHEFGHQFGAAHTFNSTVGTSCGGQRSPETAWGDRAAARRLCRTTGYARRSERATTSLAVKTRASTMAASTR